MGTLTPNQPPSLNARMHACAWGADAPPAGEKVELRNPIKDSSYQAHSGAAFGIDCSPFVRELFLSAGADGSVRLYSAVRGPPLLSAEPTATFMHGVAWSPFRPLVFAAAAGEGVEAIRPQSREWSRAEGGGPPPCLWPGHAFRVACRTCHSRISRAVTVAPDTGADGGGAFATHWGSNADLS